jgi:hypothetical protein
LSLITSPCLSLLVYPVVHLEFTIACIWWIIIPLLFLNKLYWRANLCVIYFSLTIMIRDHFYFGDLIWFCQFLKNTIFSLQLSGEGGRRREGEKITL